MMIWSRTPESTMAAIAASRSRCSSESLASVARSACSSASVIRVLTVSGLFRALSAALRQILAPPPHLRPIITQNVDHASDHLVDDVGNGVRRGVEGGYGRQDDRAHLGEIRQCAQMAEMERRFAHDKNQRPAF